MDTEIGLIFDIADIFQWKKIKISNQVYTFKYMQISSLIGYF